MERCNPAHDMLYIYTGDHYSDMSSYTIKILNNIGQTVFENLVDQPLFTVQMSTLGATGVYFIQIIDTQSQVTDIRKIILQ